MSIGTDNGVHYNVDGSCAQVDSAEEEARRVAAQWTSDPAAASSAGDAVGGGAVDQAADAAKATASAAEEPAAGKGFVGALKGAFSSLLGTKEAPQNVQDIAASTEELKGLRTQLAEAKRAAKGKASELKKAENELAALQSKRTQVPPTSNRAHCLALPVFLAQARSRLMSVTGKATSARA